MTKSDLDSKQRACIKRCWFTDDFQQGIVAVIQRMADIENAKAMTSNSMEEVFRAQGGYNRLRLLLDFVRTISTTEHTDKERKSNV